MQNIWVNQLQFPNGYAMMVRSFFHSARLSCTNIALESWVEISSQPSSSSLSSIGDEIVTTGLRVQHDLNTRRRRRAQPGAPSQVNLPTRQTGTSSQEEYEESESEEDGVMTSSNEHIVPATRLSTISRPAYDTESD